MGFTVYRPGGTKDAEFQAYARLLRQRGVDLGKLPRVPEPDTNRRWLYVWNAQAEAQSFAEELRKRTGDREWEVIPVNATASEGPLGPLVIQLSRQADGLTFALHPLSRAVVQSAFPGAIGSTMVFMDASTWLGFRETRGDLRELVRELAPALTGLKNGVLEELGYAVIDADTGETLVFEQPTVLA